MQRIYPRLVGPPVADGYSNMRQSVVEHCLRRLLFHLFQFCGNYVRHRSAQCCRLSDVATFVTLIAAASRVVSFCYRLDFVWFAVYRPIQSKGNYLIIVRVCVCVFCETRYSPELEADQFLDPTHILELMSDPWPEPTRPTVQDQYYGNQSPDFNLKWLTVWLMC